jgi:16S rRNA methyltransferase gidB
MNREEFIEETKKLGINITEEVMNKFDTYINFLIEYNEHTNLTAIKDYESILLKHFFDSLMLEHYFDFKNTKRILDIGTGAGFPGMILAIMHPEVEVTLLDSNNKKLKFLELLAEKINVKNIKIVHERAEDYVNRERQKFDVVTSRAVSDLEILSELSIPFLKIGGYFIPLKGKIDDELNRSKEIIKNLGGNIKNIFNYELIKENSTRNIILIEKVSDTPNKYPRNYSQIKRIVEKKTKIK